MQKEDGNTVEKLEKILQALNKAEPEEEEKLLKYLIETEKLYPGSTREMAKLNAKYPGTLMTLSRSVSALKDFGWFGNGFISFIMRVSVVLGVILAIFTDFGTWVQELVIGLEVSNGR